MCRSENNWNENNKYMGSIMNFVSSECSERQFYFARGNSV
jgi:hypothetical protein